MVPVPWSSQCTAATKSETAACFTAGPGHSFLQISSDSNGRCRQPCRPRSKCLQLQCGVQMQPIAASSSCLGPCSPCLLTQRSVLSPIINSTAPIPSKRVQHNGWLPAIACQGHASAGITSALRNGSAPLQFYPTAAFSDFKQCKSVLMLPATSSRSVRVKGASLALAEPTAAAATAVASAAVGASSFSLSKFVAVVLGYAVLAGSLFRSVPQILKVLQHQSTEGLSLTSYVVELCCYSISIAYNISQGYGFNTFGEVVACWLQDVILIALIFRFSRTKKRVAAATGAAVALGCAWLLSPCCPVQVLAVLQASNILTMALGSRLPQIILNMRRGNAGVLSVMTCLLNVAGNTARIFTTVVLTGDMLLMGGYLSQGMLNTILLCQSIGTARQKGSTLDRINDSNAVEESSGHSQRKRVRPGAMALDLGAAGPDAGPGGPGGMVTQPAS